MNSRLGLFRNSLDVPARGGPVIASIAGLALCGAVIVGALLVAAPASAQTTFSGNIAGLVKDATGAVVPDADVEATSPALLNPRSTKTDASGQFRMINLPIGEYTVIIAKTGFDNVTLSNIELTSNFTATANATLTVGKVSESTTIKAETPTVDVQNVTIAETMGRDTMDSIPTAKMYTDYGVLVPGMSTTAGDVGGTATDSKQMLAIHGGRNTDQQTMMNGMNFGAVHINSGAYSFLVVPDSLNQEMNMMTANFPAEVETSGVMMNMITRSGGNAYRGDFFANFGNASTQSSNVTSELAAQGVPTNVGVKNNVMVSPAVGGPMKKNRTWFFTTYQFTRRENYVNSYANANLGLAPALGGYTYKADPTNQTIMDHIGPGEAAIRVTHLLTPSNRVSVQYIWNNWCECHGGSQVASPEINYLAWSPSNLTQVLWTSVLNSKLLFEADASFYAIHFKRGPQPDAIGPSSTNAAGIKINSQPASPSTNGQYADIYSQNYTMKGSLSYVTGTHAYKVGVSYLPLAEQLNGYTPRFPFGAGGNGYYQITTQAHLVNGVDIEQPRQITYLPLPESPDDWVHKTAAYAQDQWTTHHLTLNYGLRFDWFTAGYPGGTIAPALFKTTKSFDAAQILDWKDINPRLGASYDLFGNGKTAIKFGLARYVDQYATDWVNQFNPFNELTGQSTRTVTDGAFFPQGDPLNPAANGDLGPASNNSFGSYAPTYTLDPNFANGWMKRPYNWETTAGITHQLRARMSVSLNYIRRWYGNFEAINNTLVSPSDYSPYFITTPSDSRLPGGGGQKLGPFYDVNPTAFGQLLNQDTSSSNFGNMREHWNGIDISTTMNLRNIRLQGGVGTGKTMTDNCDIVNTYFNKVQVPSSISGVGLNSIAAITPLSNSMCHLETPWLTSVKFLGSYTLPWQGVQVSATLQSQPGGNLTSNYTATSSQIAPSLGRPLSAGPTSSVVLNLVAPGSLYVERLKQLDFKVSKRFTFGRDTVKAGLGLYNALNSSSITSENGSYGTNGATWLYPVAITQGRLAKFEAQLTF